MAAEPSAQPSVRPAAQPNLRLWKAYAPAPPLQKADKSAAGTMPAGAFQYCEAMRIASGFGWYVYPPKDISLYFDGAEAYFFDDGQWFPVKSSAFEPEFLAEWNTRAPDALQNLAPPFLSELFAPGIVQLWTGYFVDTAPGWGLLIRPCVNLHNRSAIACYEGLVDCSTFKPLPLFINFKLMKTDCEIFLPAGRPLFQIQPVPLALYDKGDTAITVHDEGMDAAAGLDWAGAATVIRRTDMSQQHRPGRYASAQRKRGRG
ncbi:MAG: DUF6065 family protein [Pseudomonadota bacterium]